MTIATDLATDTIDPRSAVAIGVVFLVVWWAIRLARGPLPEREEVVEEEKFDDRWVDKGEGDE